MSVVIEVRNVDKTFRVPKHRVDSFKERAVRPLQRREYNMLRALRDVSFDVHQGEFFGIVGRNGSGKSTLLKILSSIYRADAGTIRMAGRLAPFIELGVGFNAELTSRENVTLNGVLMGLTRREAQGRLDAVLDFAGLRDFADLKLKNYSSGMLVRLAFAVMVQADADIMLVDEVLAVGDAAFAQKCHDVFREKRRAGKTIVLVTHDMSAVEGMCDRGMLLHDGEQVYLGDADETALRYYRLNFASGEEGGAANPFGVPDVNARPVDVWLQDDGGERVDNLEQDRPFTLNVVIEARHDLLEPVCGLHFLSEEGATVFGFNQGLGDDAVLRAGERMHVSARIENPLLPGRYLVDCWVSRNRAQGDIALHKMRLLEFVVFGTRRGPGSVSVNVESKAVVS